MRCQNNKKLENLNIYLKLEFLLVVCMKSGNDVISHVVKINELISGHVFQIEFTFGQAIF